MAANPSFMGNPRMEVATLTTANPNFDGTGTITPLITASANGTRITKIEWLGTGDNTTNFGLINIFYTQDNGTTWSWYTSLNVGTWTTAVDSSPGSNSYLFDDLVLKADATNVKLGCTITFTPDTPISVFAHGGDF